MAVVAVAELVVDTNIQLEQAITRVVLERIVRVRQGVTKFPVVPQSINHSRLKIDLPGLVGTEVESQVESGLAVDAVSTGT